MRQEIHVIKEFAHDFYGESLRAIFLGYIRPEYDYVSKEALIDDIKTDIRVANNSLDREGYKVFEKDAFWREAV